MSVLYFDGVWPPGIEGFNILLNIPVSMKNRNIKEYRGGSSTQKVPPPGGIHHSVFCKVMGCIYHIPVPPAVPGELFGPRVEKNIIYLKNFQKMKKMGPMCDTIFCMFFGSRNHV